MCTFYTAAQLYLHCTMVQLYRYSCCDWLLWYRYRYKLERQSGIVTTQHQVTVHAHVSCTLIIYVNRCAGPRMTMRIEERAVRGGRVEGGRRQGAADLGVGIVETCVRDVWKGIETVAGHRTGTS